ncbi:MAG: G-D-S-L family lipolytic protein [Lyngbya sp. HA4199-MV5]|jgi:lysophospholipase L1-like esterase|nr:G-D-S-L family lipolytic protein [Lyngbya sp. HA4199-MV5]
MNQTMQALLGLSLCLNAFFISFGVWLILKRGGLPYLAMRVPLLKKLGVSIVQIASFNFPYYDHRQSQLVLLPIQSSNIVFLGDSITDEGEWAELLANSAIRNRGISSDTTIGVLDRLPNLITPQPQKIFLMIGVNDLSNLGRSPAEIIQTYTEILIQIRARSPQTHVFIQSVLPINPKLFLGFVTNKNIRTLNELLQHLADEFSHSYIDLHSQFLDANQQLDTKYTSDGIHLNGIAYQRWADLINPYVLS